MLNSSCNAVCSFHLKSVEDHDNADFESDNHKSNLNHVYFKNDGFNSEPNLRDDTANLNSENLSLDNLNNPNLNHDNPTLTLKHHNPNLNNDNQSLEFEMCRRGCRSAGIQFLEAAREFAISNVR
jgi:hypothetical protein